MNASAMAGSMRKSSATALDCVWNVMAHAQKPDFVFRRNGRVHLNRRGLQFSRLLAAEVCAPAVVMRDTPCFEVVWRVLATNSIRQFPLHFTLRASSCAITFQPNCTIKCVLLVVEVNAATGLVYVVRAKSTKFDLHADNMKCTTRNEELISTPTYNYWWRSWLRHYATSRKVAGSISDGVIGIFHWHCPFSRTMALGLTQPLTEMSTRNISWGVKAAGA